MQAIRSAIGIIWIGFWIGWLLAATTAKAAAAGPRRPLAGLTGIWVVLIFAVLRAGALAVHSLAVVAIGGVVFASGIALAVWARVYLGRNWGMPTTVKADPELVTSGPYRFVRHPIYSGLVIALLGTALAINLLGLIAVALCAANFLYAASVEERNLTAAFPAEYPAYRARTKRLIPFVL